MNLEQIATVAAGEAIRQQTDLAGLVRLLEAYRWAYEYRESPLDVAWLNYLSNIVEPRPMGQKFRQVPVSFADLSTGLSWRLIPTAMAQWVRNQVAMPIEYAVKEFLIIHPYVDGNGRTAWIVRTRLIGNWNSPEPLPNYFGE